MCGETREIVGHLGCSKYQKNKGDSGYRNWEIEGWLEKVVLEDSSLVKNPHREEVEEIDTLASLFSLL